LEDAQRETAGVDVNYVIAKLVIGIPLLAYLVAVVLDLAFYLKNGFDLDRDSRMTKGYRWGDSAEEGAQMSNGARLFLVHPMILFILTALFFLVDH